MLKYTITVTDANDSVVLLTPNLTLDEVTFLLKNVVLTKGYVFEIIQVG